jgi:DNA-binding transcriptional regulator YiaG
MTSTGVKRIRRELGLTQEGLAKAVGVDRVTVARWETNVHRIPEPTVRLIRLLHAGARGTAKGRPVDPRARVR